MPMTPMGIYYKSLGAIRSYQHENGVVYVAHNDEFYAVTVIKQTTPYSEEYKTRGRLDKISASEFFDVACSYVRGEIKWTEPVRKFSCKYNPNKYKGCTDTNCPCALGGATYREIFGLTCPFRQTRSR